MQRRALVVVVAERGLEPPAWIAAASMPLDPGVEQLEDRARALRAFGGELVEGELVRAQGAVDLEELADERQRLERRLGLGLERA